MLCDIVSLKKVSIEIDEKLDLQELKKLLEKKGETEVELIIRQKDTKFTIKLENPRKYNLKLPERSASTIAGFIINLAKRIPETGESFKLKKLIITVISRNQTRITKILIKQKS